MNAIPLKKRRRFARHWSVSTASVLALTVALVIAGYALYQTKNLLRGPLLEVTTETGKLAVSPLINLRGRTERIDYLTIDNQPIFTNELGEFSQKLLLAPGYNIITIIASDRFGRSTRRVIEIVYKNQTPLIYDQKGKTS